MSYELYTPKRKYPVKIKEEFKWDGLKKRLIIQGSISEPVTTPWFWNLLTFDRKSESVINEGLKKVERLIDSEANASIEASLAGYNRDRQVERRVNQMFNKMW